MPIRTIRPSLLALVWGGLVATPAAAQDPSTMSCPQLRAARVATLKAAGVCVDGARPSGAGGCTTSDPRQAPLTSAQRQIMARILLAERIKMCR